MSDQLLESLQKAKLARILVLLALILPLVASAPAHLAQAASRLHPDLQQEATQHPNATAKVIVQKQGPGNSAESLVPQLGGTVTKDLSIINAFAAEMPAKSLAQLAKSSNVRWISPDGPVQKADAYGMFTTWATDMGSLASVSRAASFNSTPINAGSYIWFNSAIDASGLPSSPTRAATINFDKPTVVFASGGMTYTLSVPGAVVTYDPAAISATTSYDADRDSWITRVPYNMSGDNFLTGMVFGVPVNLPANISNVTWSGHFTTDTPGLTANWQSSAAVYSSFDTNYNTLGIKPCDSGTASQYINFDRAGTPENFKAGLMSGARSTGGTNYVGTYTSLSVTPTPLFNNFDSMIDSPAGPNGTFGYGSSTIGTFSGFAPEKSPGTYISRVEVVLYSYAATYLTNRDGFYLTAKVGDVPGGTVQLNNHAFDTNVGATHAGAIYVDITPSRCWTWADFETGLELTIDQTNLASSHNLYYDAIGLRITTLPGADNSSTPASTPLPRGAIDASQLGNAYNSAVHATNVWNEAPDYLQGQGVTVAVVDSGIFKTRDLKKQLIGSANFNTAYHTSSDAYGHGTFVAGIIAGNGAYSNGRYVGIAPKANLLNVRVSDDQGMATEADVISGLQWVLQNKTRYNIRVVNMSLNAATPQSYHVSPLDAASEVLWFNGIVVVVSAGNNGTANLYAPANDPFVITVGATNDNSSTTLNDDTIAPFSAYGVDENGDAKPDLVAPGTHIIALLPQNNSLTISRDHQDSRVSTNYFRMSGTSMAAPMVVGAVALLLQHESALTPDQVKYRLKATAAATSQWPGYDPVRAGAGYLDIYAAVHGATTQSANTGIPASQMLWSGTDPINWGSVNWGSVNWGSVNWGSVNWGSVNWGSVNWGSDYWAQ